MNRTLRIVQLNVLLLLMQLSLHAQVYPVQVVPQLLPPYTLNFSDYYQGTQEKLVVLLTNTDLTKPALQVRLKMSIQGQSAKFKSRDGVYYPPITLDGGAPQRITLADLAPYFNPDNLDIEGITRSQFQQNQKLPEGFYQFCFEAYEYNTNRLVGRSNCAMAWISLQDPPLLNLPVKGESIAYKDPTNIIFQWTPRNMGSPTAAFNTEYEFTLVELWDNGIAPEAAFGTTQPLYRTTTQATTLLYGPSEPLLIPGKRYGWRIRAQASDGSQNTDAYRNNGYSEIYWFTYQRDCPTPFNVQSEVSGGRATITWNAAIQQTRFTVDYREKGQTANQWYTVNSSTNRVMLYDLKQDKQYEYRVGAYCDDASGAFPASGAVYSDIKNFYIDGSSAGAEGGGCNILQPDLQVANRNPIQTLLSGEVITAGDFPVKLITVQGQGNFSGTGYITIPFIGKVAVKVRFSGITVNTDKQLIGGIIETTYDKEEKQLVDVNDITGDPASVGILKDLKDHVPNPDTAPLDDLIQFADKLSDVSTSTIDNALALTSAEKTQLKQNIADMNAAKEVLEDSSSTPQQKADAEQKLREAVKEAAPIVQKLGDTVGKGLIKVIINTLKDGIKKLQSTSVSDDAQALADLVAQVKALAEKELPQAQKDQFNKALQEIADAKTAYDEASVEYKNASSGEAKQQAKTKMDAAEKRYNDAKQTLSTLEDEKEKLIGGVADIIVEAVKKIRTEKDSLINSVNTFNQDVQKFNKEVNAAQGVDDTNDGGAEDDIIFLGDFTDETGYTDNERTEFLNKAASLLSRKKALKGAVVYKIFTDFFAKPESISSDMMSDEKINGKDLINQLIQKQTAHETRDNMLTFAHDYLIKVLEAYITTLNK